ncbi:MAG: hypothetical protein LBC83_02485 [Oscillospiraceae bacterium]|nr:hypothetical protein [Oscillospiraceae bacterium]
MHGIAAVVGAFAGAADYALLVLASPRLLQGRRSGALWLAGALLLPAVALFCCALLRPADLLFFGAGLCAALVLLALAGGLRALLRSMKTNER